MVKVKGWMMGILTMWAVFDSGSFMRAAILVSKSPKSAILSHFTPQCISWTLCSVERVNWPLYHLLS